MSRINEIIPRQSFELVRNRIGEILADELNNQFVLSGVEEINAKVFIESNISFDKTDLPAVNVTLEKGLYEGPSAINIDGTYAYDIDCYTSAKSNSIISGDALAMIRLQRLLGVCRAIIGATQYNTLGYAPGFVSLRRIEGFAIANPTQQDALCCAQGRLKVSVKVPEISSVIQPPLIAGYETSVKLAQSENGYVFTKSS